MECSLISSVEYVRRLSAIQKHFRRLVDDRQIGLVAVGTADCPVLGPTQVHKAKRADGLVAADCPVDVPWIAGDANGTLYEPFG
jgi:hypothetical protein